MANGFDKIINESFSKYLTKNGVSTSALNRIYGKNTSKKLNESKLNESWVIDTWGQTDEDPRDFAREYDLGIKKIDLGTEHWSETSYKFTGSRENIERAINDGYFYSGNECSDDVADLIASNNLKGEALNEAKRRTLDDLYSDPDLEKLWDSNFNKFVPESGNADTPLGEIIRCFSKLSYAFLQNGEMLGKGWINRSTEDAGNDIIDAIKELGDDELKVLIDKIWNTRSENAYENYLARFYEKVIDKYLKNNNIEESLLNEAVPRDLMGKIKNTRRYRRNKMADGFNTDSIDYQSADMQEITATDVMRMKKSGEDLSDIYVLNDDGDIIELDRDGHPIESGSTGYQRANQSLKKTLDNATKIYKGKIGLFSQTQPDKYAERASDPERRRLNIRYGGHGRSDSGDVKHYAKSFHKELEEPGRRIKELRKAYDDGDISRKEMEAKIAKIKAETKDPLSSNNRLKWAAHDYNSAAENKVKTRYYDSNQAARKNRDAYEDAKSSLNWAKYKLKDNEEKLAKTQAGNGYGNQRVEELKRKIASLKHDLAYYEKQLAEDPVQKDLDELQRGITKATQDITNNQAVIDKLLHRK